MLILYISVLLCLLALIALPYERVVILRIFAARKIKKLCHERDVSFKVINRAYPFSKNDRNEFDLILRIGRTVVPIKFFSAAYKGDTIIFDKAGKICVVRRYQRPLPRDEKKKIKTVRHYMSTPKMKISKRMIGERHTCFPVFLNVPKFDRVLLRDEKGNISNFYDGANRVGGCSFLDKNTLFELISLYEEA